MILFLFRIGFGFNNRYNNRRQIRKQAIQIGTKTSENKFELKEDRNELYKALYEAFIAAGDTFEATMVSKFKVEFVFLVSDNEIPLEFWCFFNELLNLLFDELTMSL